MFQKYKKRIIYSIVFGALVYIALSIYANLGQLFIAFGQFHWLMFIPVLLLSLGNYLMRFLKFEYYTKVLDIRIDRKMNFVIFLSSFIMSVTPGKVGEVFKSYLLKEQNGTPISKSAPIIIAERITDFISLIMLSLVGVVMFGYESKLIIIIGILFIAMIFLISSKKISYSIIGFFEKFAYFKKISGKIHTAYDSIYRMVQIKELIICIFLSILAWFCECLGTYIVINSFGNVNPVHIDIYASTFIYGFATIAGSVTMLPGGLGATDASITFLLITLKSVSQSVAVAATLLVRVATLWFAVIIGIIAVLYYQKLSNKKIAGMALDSK